MKGQWIESGPVEVQMTHELAVNDEFPETATERLRFLVKYAVLAPSSHNTQPWLFKLHERSLDLIADRTRALPVVDPNDRALTISCGAALEHLVIAARHFGCEPMVDEFPSSDRDHLATVRLTGTIMPDTIDQEMFAAMPLRRTTRTKYEDRILSEELRRICCDIATERGTELKLVIDEEKRTDIADLVAQGDRIQFSEPRFRCELAAWVHSRRSATQDGMSGESFGMPDVLSPVGALVIRTFDMGKGIAASDREKILSGSPLLAVFSSRDDGPADWMATGRGLARVLLKLTAKGATAAFLNQPIEVEMLRPRLQEAVYSTRIPQLLMRFGYGPKVHATARRPLDDVFI